MSMISNSPTILAQNTYQLLEPTVVGKESATLNKDGFTLSEYVTSLYGAALLIGAVLAVIVIILGGGMYITGKSLPNIQKAREWLKNGVIGIILFISIALLLNTINPSILNLDKIFAPESSDQPTNSNSNQNNQNSNWPDYE